MKDGLAAGKVLTKVGTLFSLTLLLGNTALTFGTHMISVLFPGSRPLASSSVRSNGSGEAPQDVIMSS